MEKEVETVLQVMEQKFLYSPWRFMLEHISTHRLWRTPHWSSWMLEPVGILHWNRLHEGPVELWRKEPTTDQVCWQDSNSVENPF